ncbi:hypothetical protein [Burkholderia ubonensis]|uniref:hypothetical protein n=1 Tax=Burkholderia ubonensis TaxID=101571 RepID=UPI0018AD2A5A|nr:hypothetical protein [Burkholderia ubonensis]
MSASIAAISGGMRVESNFPLPGSVSPPIAGWPIVGWIVCSENAGEQPRFRYDDNFLLSGVTP